METPATHPQTGYVHVMYALHALAGFIGVTSAATIVGAFVFGLPSILAIIMNYVRRDSVRGTWLESHFHWQSRTFWTAIVIAIALYVIGFILFSMGIIGLASTPLTGAAGAAGAGAAFGGALLTLWLGAIGTGIWILYRVIRGWLALGQGKALNV
jgi:uncharacterized membrane protein